MTDRQTRHEPTKGRIEIAPGIRVLAAGEHGWAVWVDWEDELPFYPTQEQAIRAARQRATEEVEEASADEPPAPMPPEERVAWVKARAWAVTADLSNAERLLREHGYTVIPPRPEDSA